MPTSGPAGGRRPAMVRNRRPNPWPNSRIPPAVYISRYTKCRTIVACVRRVPSGRKLQGARSRALSPLSGYASIAMNLEAGLGGLLPPLLRDRVFRRYWGASTVSMFGDQISSVALPLTAVLVLHAGAASMGYLTALQWLPSLLFALHAGAWVDRRGKRRMAMILADLGRAAALATIPLCYALHALTLAQMYVVTFIAGALSVLFTVSDGTLFVSIVPPDSYVDGQSLIYGSRAFSFMGGPSVGGLLVEALTAPFAVVADALSFLGSAVQLAVIKPAEPPSSDGADG